MHADAMLTKRTWDCAICGTPQDTFDLGLGPLAPGWVAAPTGELTWVGQELAAAQLPVQLPTQLHMPQLQLPLPLQMLQMC